MAPTPSPESQQRDGAAGLRRRLLLDVALRSIEHGVRCGAPLQVDPNDYPEDLRSPRSVFVTLRRHGALRGCLGELSARQPLVVAVAETAFKSATRDPRFSPLREAELDGLELEISVLSPLEAIPVSNERELLEQLRPGVDGLVLRDGGAQATYLPSVWESLPEPSRFVAELKRKAGLQESHWSKSLEVSRFTVESIS